MVMYKNEFETKENKIWATTEIKLQHIMQWYWAQIKSILCNSGLICRKSYVTVVALKPLKTML